MIFFSFFLVTIQITCPIAATEVPSSKYRNLLTKNYSKRWLQRMGDRQSTTNPYCNLCCLNISQNGVLKDCGFHTLCMYENNRPGSHCKGFMPVQFTEGEKYTIVDAHNTLRNRVASGKESRGVSGAQPSAANMRRLEWDEELARIAERWVTQCSSAHDRCRDVDRFPVGQNIASDYASRSNHLEFIQRWYNKVKNFNYKNLDHYTSKNHSTTEQYTQLVWAETYKVGCARAVFQSIQGSDVVYREIFVCNYGPAGNIPGQSVYIRGTPCTACYVETKCESEYPYLCGRSCENGNCDQVPPKYDIEEDEEVKREGGNDEVAIIDPKVNYNRSAHISIFYGTFILISFLFVHLVL